jgi:ABC-type uncharacterized transport system substrate-binding protein
MSHYRRRLTWLLLLVTLLAAPGAAPALAGEPLNIAMILWRGETEAEKGFKDGLKELGYSARYAVMNAGQDRAELGRLLREDLKPRLKSFDYVYVFGTTATLATKTIVDDKVPVIFNIVADPVGAGIVRSWQGSGANIAGVSNEIPLDLQLKTAMTLVPIKRLGLFFNPREKNSMLIRDKILTVAQPLGIEIVDLRSPPALDMLQENLQKLRDQSIKVDAVYLPADSFIVSAAKLVGGELRAGKVKSIAALESYVDQGALMGLVPGYRELGRAAAMLVHRHVKGQALQEMAVEADRAPLLKINLATARALNVAIPETLRKRAILVDAQ